MDSLLLILLAVLPPIILMLLVYKFDKIEREPLPLLIMLFFAGVLSCIPASIMEWLGETLGSFLGIEGIVRELLFAFFVVALAEEGFKYLFTKWLTWKNQAFNYRFDGIVYTVFTSLGFALAENIGYVMGSGVGTAFVRGISAVPLHASCGVIMGIFYGFAKGCDYAGNDIGKKKNVKKALGFPILIHGFYDFCLFTQNDLLILIWILFTITIFIVVFVRIRYYSKSDHPIVPETNNRFLGRQGTLFTGFAEVVFQENCPVNSGIWQSGGMTDGYQGMAGGQLGELANTQLHMQSNMQANTQSNMQANMQSNTQPNTQPNAQPDQNINVEIVSNQNGNLEYFSKSEKRY